MPSAMTPSQARTFSASSIVRSMRDGGATAPKAPGVTTVSWIVDIRASASSTEMPVRSSASSPRSVCRRARSTASVCGVERLGLEPRADAGDLGPDGRLAALELVEGLPAGRRS